MAIVKALGMVFLAVFLILNGLSAISEVPLSYGLRIVIDLVAITAGVLILISIGRCFTTSMDR